MDQPTSPRNLPLKPVRTTSAWVLFAAIGLFVTGLPVGIFALFYLGQSPWRDRATAALEQMRTQQPMPRAPLLRWDGKYQPPERDPEWDEAVAAVRAASGYSIDSFNQNGRGIACMGADLRGPSGTQHLEFVVALGDPPGVSEASIRRGCTCEGRNKKTRCYLKGG